MLLIQSPILFSLRLFGSSRFRRRASSRNTKNGSVYSGSITKIFLYANLVSNGQNNCVPQVVCASSNGCVIKHKNQSQDHCFQLARFSQRETSHPKNNPPRIEKSIECVIPRCHSSAVTVSTKN